MNRPGTLLAVAAGGIVLTAVLTGSYAWLCARQLTVLRYQTESAERARVDAVQLLRIQADLNQLGAAMRELAADHERTVAAAAPQFERTRRELTDAIAQHTAIAPAPDEHAYLATPLTQFWNAVDLMFRLAHAGREDDARTQLRLAVERQHAGLMTTIAYLLLDNNEQQGRASEEVRDAAASLQRQALWLLGGALVSLAVAAVSIGRVRATLLAPAHASKPVDEESPSAP